MKALLLAFWLLMASPAAFGWGFYAHQRINRLAIFTLPAEMLPFYKRHLLYLMEASVNPDKRRYAVVGEAARHYVDVDAYGDSLWARPFWPQAVAYWGEDTLNAHGTAGWHIQLMKHRLTEAFQERNAAAILKLSAEIGHYIADANVPLHTTRNYNGQLTGQEGIHAFWESRLPERYAEGYDFFVGPAAYVEQPGRRAWAAIRQAHACLDTLFALETRLTAHFGPARKYTIAERNGLAVKQYSTEFSAAYHAALRGQVERQMRASVKMIGDFWLTCWIDAGQPDLLALPEKPFTAAEKQAEASEQRSWLQRLFPARSEN